MFFAQYLQQTEQARPTVQMTPCLPSSTGILARPFIETSDAVGTSAQLGKGHSKTSRAASADRSVEQTGKPIFNYLPANP
jgi:hypothetical protein